jgi:phosphoenolpyruvate carboxykinase (GTP)
LLNPPKIFEVNWFRKDREGSFLWPGYSENMRVLKWIVDRVKNRVGAEQTPIGLVPRKEDLNLTGLNITAERLRQATSIDPSEWLSELNQIQEYFAQLGADSLTDFEDRIKSTRAGLEKQRG